MTQTQPVNAFAIQQAKKPQPKTVLELLQNDAFKTEIGKVLPKHMNPERMLRVALTTVKMSDKLQHVSMHSFASAMLKCSQFGLEPDGRHAHLIPFKANDGTYDLNLIFDYKGLVSLVRRSGEVADIMADVVYEDDEFACVKGTESKLVHIPNLKSKNRSPDNIFAVYSCVKLKNGDPSFEVMTKDEINAIRDESQGYKAFKKGHTKSSPWETAWTEMAKKTVFRRHTKWLTLSPEVADALYADDDKSDDARFQNAKSVSATIVSPEFTMPAVDSPSGLSSFEPKTTDTPPQQESEQRQAPGAPASTSVPNETLGASKPRGRKKEAEAQPEPQPEAPKGGTKEAYLIQLRELMEKSGVSESEVVKVLVNAGALTTPDLNFATTNLLRDLTTQEKWNAILVEIGNL